MVSVTGPGENGDTLVLEPDTLEAGDPVAAATAREVAVNAVIAAISEDAATLPEQYLAETEVPGGGE